MENLAFRRQFVLSNKRIHECDGWDIHSYSVQNQTFYLHLHPDLNFVEATGKSLQLILLGFIIDPFHPENESQAILQNLASGECFDDVLKGAFSLGGRFIIIAIDNSGIKLFNDAMALREVFYFRQYGIVACGSTPSILASWFGLDYDTDKDFQEYYTSRAFNSQERVMIGDRTLINGVRHLMPNHYLNFQTMEIHRFWPLLKEPKLTVSASVDQMANILTGTFKAIAGRYTVHQGLTSGWDTRMLLAASRGFLKDIHFFFLRGFKADSAEKASVDFIVAQKMAKELGLDFEVIDFLTDAPDEHFKEIYYANNILARPKLLPAFYHAYMHNYENTVTISGTGGNEILRSRIVFPMDEKDSNRIARIWHYESFTYVKNTIDAWFHSNDIIKKVNYRKIDIFFWEQMFANWGCLSASEQDIVREELRPFNNRAFIALYISLPFKYRYIDNPLGHARIIRKLWPELLKYDMDLSHASFRKTLRKIKLERAFAVLYSDLKRLRKVNH